MHTVIRCLTFFVLAGLLAACGEPTSPPGTPARPPALSIQDGAHGAGNPGFFFLPPLVKSPAGNPEFGDAPFAVVSPVVRICRLAADPALGPTTCAASVITFSGAQILVSVPDRQYSVNWDTKASNLSTTAFYRLSVFVGDQMLGFADIDPVTPQEMRNPRTGETITLLDGRTLPIKFAIETDGLCEGPGECTIVRVTNAGGSIVLPSGYGGIYLPEGWLPPGFTEVSMTLQRVATGANNDCLESGFVGAGLIRQYEGCMQITTVPDLTGSAGIQRRGVVGLCVEISEGHPDYHNLQMFKSDAGRPIVALADADGSVIEGFDCDDGFAGTPEVIGSLPGPLQQLAQTAWRRTMRGLSRIEFVETAHAIDLGASGGLEIGMDFSHFGWGVQGTMSGVGSGTVGVPVNGVTTLSARVLANHVHNGAQSQTSVLQNVPVTFTVTSTDGGQLAAVGGTGFTSGPLTVLTNQAGEAQVDFQAGANVATHTIVATAAALDAPITFTVTAGSAVIDFETWPATTDGPCSSCALSTQYGPHAQFYFVPDGGAIATFPASRVQGGPYHAVTNHSATVPSSPNGYGVGTLAMAVGGNPTQASFQLRYSADTTIAPQVTAYRYDSIEGVAVPVTGAVTFTAAQIMTPSGTPAREATVSVSIPAGIFRIEISGGTSTSAIFLDDITIVGAVFPVIN